MPKRAHLHLKMNKLLVIVGDHWLFKYKNECSCFCDNKVVTCSCPLTSLLYLIISLTIWTSSFTWYLYYYKLPSSGWSNGAAVRSIITILPKKNIKNCHSCSHGFDYRHFPFLFCRCSILGDKEWGNGGSKYIFVTYCLIHNGF